MLEMQDISNWQGEKVPELVAKHEVLAIKASEGNSFLDPEFGDNWAFAEANEKARVAYHFLHPSIPGLQQAHFFLDQIDRFGIKTGDMFAVDLEVTDGRHPDEVDQCAKEFVDAINAETKAKCWVYTNYFTAQGGNCAHLGESPLWIAEPSSPPGRPKVPAPWNEWLAHQFGIVRGIDADVVNVSSVDSLAQYGALIGQPKPPPNIVTLTITDGTATADHEIDQNMPVGNLRGYSLTAGDAKLSFSE